MFVRAGVAVGLAALALLALSRPIAGWIQKKQNK